MVLLLIVTQSHLLIQNLLEGLIWLVVPAMMVVFNDCFAYICGFFFGRTPLIKVISSWNASSTVVECVMYGKEQYNRKKDIK